MDEQLVQNGEPTTTATERRVLAVSRRRFRRPRLLMNIVTVIVTLVFSYVAFSNIDLTLAWRAIRRSDYWWLIASLGVFGLSAVARAVRWRSLFAGGRRPPLSTVTNAMLIGYFYNSILPARAGEAARVLVLTRRSTTSPVEIVGTVVLERIYDVLAILVIFFAAEPWLPHVSWFGAAAVAAIVLAVLIATIAIVLAVFGDRPLRILFRPLGRLSLFSQERLEHTISELTHGLSGLRHPGLALEAFLWTILAWMLTVVSTYCVTVAFHLHLSLSAGVLVTVAVGLSMILPAPPAAVGVFEGAALIALNAYRIPHSPALSFALVTHLINLVPLVIAGALLLHHNSRHPSVPE